jgi:transcriptional regulator GlxA family with amidase domain
VDRERAKDEAYTVSEVARLLAYSRRTIVRLFENEPGVIIKQGKRRTLRIPRAVYQRVVHRLTVR